MVEPASQQPAIKPIKARPISYLSSASIPKSTLKAPEEVIRKYPQLRYEARAGKLAVKLARESFFSEGVLAKCTVSGCRDLPALPLEELNQLKQVMLAQFPRYWASPQEFEATWACCTEAIGQAAKALRKRGC